MSYSSTFSSIRDRFDRLIFNPQKIAVQYDNARLVDPTKQVEPNKQERPDDKIWCLVTILPGDRRIADMGAPAKRTRCVGVAMVQIFVPNNRGDKEGLALGDLIVENFTATNEGIVRFTAARLERIGRVNRWWQINVNCPFESEWFTNAT